MLDTDLNTLLWQAMLNTCRVHELTDAPCKACTLRVEALEAELHPVLDQLRGELAGARSTIDHMSKAMSWLGGHDREGLDHLDEAMHEARSRESAVRQAQRWAKRAKAAEAVLGQVAEIAAVDGEPDNDWQHGYAHASGELRAVFAKHNLPLPSGS